LILDNNLFNIPTLGPGPPKQDKTVINVTDIY